MAKRLSDTGKWDKAWFRKLKPKYKCFWEYLRDKCNLIGLWEIDFESASFHIGEEVLENEILEVFGNKILKIKNKLLIVGFCHFQYGESLNLKSPIHKKVFDLLTKHTLYDTLYNRVGNTVEVKAEVEVEEKRERKEKEEVYVNIQNLFNKTCPKLKPVLKLSINRKKNLNALIQEYKPDNVETFFEVVFNKIRDSDFLNGGGKNGFLMTFDWMLKPENFLKILEDNYKDGKTNNNKTKTLYSDDFKRKIAEGLQS